MTNPQTVIEDYDRVYREAQPIHADYVPYTRASFWADAEEKAEAHNSAVWWRLILLG